MKIIFFGASVTAQSINHSTGAVTGYVDCLMQRCKGTNYEVNRVAYGSSQYCNMGIHGLSNALLETPNVIFFEWHTTGETYLSKESLQLQNELLKSIGVRMILLVLPSKRHSKNDITPKYDILTDTNIPCLDLRYLIDHEHGTPLLRDEVHTNEFGAQIYSQHIHKYITECVIDSAPKPTFTCMQDLLSQIDIKYQSILSRQVPLHIHLSPRESLSLASSHNSRIIFTLTRGPKCPNVTISFPQKKLIEKVVMVDRWSYYNRKSCGIEFTLEAMTEALITPIGEIPDYETLCPKLIEKEYGNNCASSPFDLCLSLDSVFVSIASSITFKRLSAIGIG